MGWFSRYRHSRGFGIHSPFAYRFITECLNERLPYYDYTRLPESRQKLLYRVTSHFSPKGIAVVGDVDASPAFLACPAARQVPVSVADMVVASGPGATAPMLAEALEHGAVIYLPDCEQQTLAGIRLALDAIGHGMTFDNGRNTAIVVPFKHLPRQDFNVKF